MLQTVKITQNGKGQEEEEASMGSAITTTSEHAIVMGVDDVILDEVVQEVASDGRTVTNNSFDACETIELSHSIGSNRSETTEPLKIVNFGHKKRICATQDKEITCRRTIYCCVYGCKANSYEMPFLSFFRFPEAPLRCKAWTRFTKRRTIRETDIDLMHSSIHRMCSAHFLINDFVDQFLRNELIESAVPIVYDAKDCPWYKDKGYMPIRTPEKQDRVIPQVNGSPEKPSPPLDLNKIDRWDLCEYHRLVVNSVTLVGTELNDIKFCIKCGSAVEDPVLISPPNVYKISCKREHVVIVTTEFNEKFRDYVVACQRGHRSRGASDPPCHSPCHLCNDHYLAPHAITPHNGECKSRFVGLPNVKRKRGRPTILRNVEKKTLPNIYPPLVDHLFRFPFTAKLVSDVGVSCDIQPEGVQTTTRGTQLSSGQLKGVEEMSKNRELKKLRETVSNLEKQITAEELAPVLTERYLIDKILPKYCKGVTLKLFEMQVLSSITPTMRWPTSIITLAKVIEHENKTAYTIVKNLMRFPSRNVLNKYDLLPSKMSVAKFIRETFDKKDDVELKPPTPKKDCTNVQVDCMKECKTVCVTSCGPKIGREEIVETIQIPQMEEVDNIPQLSLPESDETTTSVTTILDEAIKELELSGDKKESPGVIVERVKESEEAQNDNMVVLELMGGESDMSRFRILGSAVQDYETGVYQILAESVDSPEHGVESLEVHVLPYDTKEGEDK